MFAQLIVSKGRLLGNQSVTHSAVCKQGACRWYGWQLPTAPVAKPHNSKAQTSKVKDSKAPARTSSVSNAPVTSNPPAPKAFNKQTVPKKYAKHSNIPKAPTHERNQTHFKVPTSSKQTVLKAQAASKTSSPIQSTVMDNTVHTRRYSNGDVYVGQFFNDKHHGQGEITYSSGATWKGEFLKGKQYTGFGFSLLDEKCGPGWSNGYYMGPLEAGERQGVGKMNFEDGSYWEGLFRNGIGITGKGYVPCDDGTVECVEKVDGKVISRTLISAGEALLLAGDCHRFIDSTTENNGR